jgi:transposase InsO family protein
MATGGSAKKVRRLMREHDLQPRRRRRYVATTDSDHDAPIFPNLAPDVVVTGPNQRWVPDITYIAIAAGFVYLAAILDAWSRRVVGYAISRSIDARLALAALRAPFLSAGRRRAASTIPIEARSMLRKLTASSLPSMDWSDRWDGGAIHTTTPRPRAS